jgi:hypothetical protein
MESGDYDSQSVICLSADWDSGPDVVICNSSLRRHLWNGAVIEAALSGDGMLCRIEPVGC